MTKFADAPEFWIEVNGERLPRPYGRFDRFAHGRCARH